MAGAPLAAVDVSGAVTDGLRTVTTFVPTLVGSLVIVLVGSFVARAIAKLVDSALGRTGSDQAVGRGGIRRALTTNQCDASDIAAQPVSSAIFVPVLSAAIGTLWIEALTSRWPPSSHRSRRSWWPSCWWSSARRWRPPSGAWSPPPSAGLSYGPGLGGAAGALVRSAKAALDEVGIATTVTAPCCTRC